METHTACGRVGKATLPHSNQLFFGAGRNDSNAMFSISTLPILLRAGDISPGNSWSLDRGGVSFHEIMSLFCPCRVLLSKESQQAQGEKEEDLRVKCEKNIFFSSVLRVFPFFFFLARLSLLCLPRELSPPPPAFLSTLPPSAHPPESSKGQTLFLSFFQQHIAFQAAFQSETKV